MRAIREVAARWATAGWRADLVVAILAGIGYGILAQRLFEGRPTGIDEVVSIWQATQLFHGHLGTPLPLHPEAVLTRFTGVGMTGHIGQFSLGTALAILPFVAIGAIWLTGPVWGGVGVFIWARLVRQLESHPPTALAAVILLAVSPFWAVQSASQLAHVPITVLICAIGLMLARVLRAEPASSAALWLGLLVGLAAMVRPVEALAAAVPAAIIVLWRVARGQLPRRTIPQGLLGVAVPLALLLGANTIQTGAPLRFGYDVVWGPKHRLGFHESPLGTQHTPATGMANVKRQLLDLGTSAWQSRVSALLPAAIGLLLGLAAMGILDLWAFAVVLGVAVGYWTYWGGAAWLGPRFFLPLLPFIMLWVARGPRLLARWHRHLGTAASLALVGCVIDGAITGVPALYAHYDALRLSSTRDLSKVLAGAPTPGLIIARGDMKSANQARLRNYTGDPAASRVSAKGADPCTVLWSVRWHEVGVPSAPAVTPAWQAWCKTPDFQGRFLVTSDATAALLLSATHDRPIVRDLGSRTALLADSLTFRNRTRLLLWERVERFTWRPRLALFDYDSARGAWAREEAAFALARREAGR